MRDQHPIVIPSLLNAVRDLEEAYETAESKRKKNGQYAARAMQGIKTACQRIKEIVQAEMPEYQHETELPLIIGWITEVLEAPTDDFASRQIVRSRVALENMLADFEPEGARDFPLVATRDLPASHLSDAPPRPPKPLPAWLPKNWESQDYPAVDTLESFEQWLDFQLTVLGFCELRDQEDRLNAVNLDCSDVLRDAYRLVDHLLDIGRRSDDITRLTGTPSISEVRSELGTIRRWLMKSRSAPQTLEGVSFSTDYRSVNWFGTEYTFTVNQAPVVKLLYECFKKGASAVGDETLLRAVDHASPPARLNVLFRNHPAWGTMIISGATKGTHRLKSAD